MNNKLRRGALIAAALDQGGGDDFYNPNPNYLTIVALEDGLTASLSVNDVEYSIDGNDNWTTLTAGDASPAINKNHYISFRGNLTPTSSAGVGTFTISKSCDLTGNCNSLLFGDNAADNLDLTGKNHAFFKLFYNCSTIKNVLSNFLPATKLASNCYRSMFYNCLSLATAPALPATTLVDYCYHNMFYNCDNITKIKSNVVPCWNNHDYYATTDKIGIFIGPKNSDYIWRGVHDVPNLFVYTQDENYNMNDVILFNVGGRHLTFIAKKGMTWEQLINSYEYNGYNDLVMLYFDMNGNSVVCDTGGGIYQIIQKDGVNVSLDDIIVENYNYTLYWAGGGYA